MEEVAALAIPRTALRRLEFLVGDFSGFQALYPPDSKSVRYPAICMGKREACDRFVQIDFYADVPDHGVHTFTAFITFSQRKQLYEMWLFSSTTEEPLHMIGDFHDHRLILVSDPWPMQWGLQRLRGTFIPDLEGSYEFLLEVWEPDGYAKLRSTTFHKRPIDC